MSHTLSSPFLRLPLEIRDMIYGHLLPDEDDICSALPWKVHFYPGHTAVDHVEQVNRIASLRRDGAPCYPEILRVNHQIYEEASRILYARAFTITVTSCRVSFLREHYQEKGIRHKCYGYSGAERGASSHPNTFPVGFPFHRIKALRVRVVTPDHTNSNYCPKVCEFYNCEYFLKQWHNLLNEQLQLVCRTLNRITESKGFLRQFIVEVKGSSTEQAPSFHGHVMKSNIHKILKPLSDSMRAVQSCEIILGSWASECADTMLTVLDVGRVILSKTSSGLKQEHSAFLSKTQHQRVEPVIAIDDSAGEEDSMWPNPFRLYVDTARHPHWFISRYQAGEYP